MSHIMQGNTNELWYTLIHEGQKVSNQPLNPSLEKYLVDLLSRFYADSSLAKSAVGLDFLEALQLHSLQGQFLALQTVGDKCLLLSGLFPEQAQRRRVDVNYYVQLGRQAYGILTTLSPYQRQQTHFFASLREAFVTLMNVLQSLRHGTSMDIAQNILLSLEIAEKTGGTYAKKCLQLHHVGQGSSVLQ